MRANLDTLALLANVTVAFVAFAVVVATLKRTLGQALNPLQRLLVRWFIECGMLVVSIELLPFVLAGFVLGEHTLARISIFYALIATLAYVFFYARRRLAIKAATPVSSVLVIAGFVIWLPILGLAGFEIFFTPSLALLVAFSFWALFAAAIVFVTFLATFIFEEEPPENQTRSVADEGGSSSPYP